MHSNPINWPNLRWLKASLQNVITGYQETLGPSEATMLMETLHEIAEDYPEHASYAGYLASQLPMQSNLLWIPRSGSSFQGRVFDAEYQRVHEQEKRIWWEVSNFLGQFTEHRPTGSIIETVSSFTSLQDDFDRLKRQVEEGNAAALPAYLRLTGLPPDVTYPGICYFCDTHNQRLHYGSYANMQCPKTIWRSGEELGTKFGKYIPSSANCRIRMELTPNFARNLINDMKDRNNLFALKKREFPGPTTPRALLDRLLATHKQEPAFILFRNEIENFYKGYLSKAMQVIAELNIAPTVPKYPLVPITWTDIVYLTNLRVDLIDNIPDFTQRWNNNNYSRRLGYLHENAFPITIVGFTILGVNKPRSPSSPPHYWLSNRRQGITIDDYSKDAVAPVRFSTFG